MICLFLIKKFSNAMLGKGDLHPISPKTPAFQYQHMKIRRERENRRYKEG